MPGVTPWDRTARRVAHWARYASWTLLGGGLLLLVVNAIWRLGWGPVAVVLLIAGYATGVVAVLPIIGRTVRAFFQAFTAFLPTPVAFGVATALLAGATGLVAWAWVTSSW
jgi:hypothetical protein